MKATSIFILTWSRITPTNQIYELWQIKKKIFIFCTFTKLLLFSHAISTASGARIIFTLLFKQKYLNLKWNKKPSYWLTRKPSSIFAKFGSQKTAFSVCSGKIQYCSSTSNEKWSTPSVNLIESETTSFLALLDTLGA